MAHDIDFRTLVLCKVTPSKGTDYTPLYKRLLPHISKQNIQRFVTLGGFDAVCIYPTPESGAKENEWLSNALEDKKNIIDSITDRVSYHPIHLLGDSIPKEFWADRSKYAFFFITFIYGIGHAGFSEDTLTKKIVDTLKYGSNKRQINEVAVYRCVNISDLVVFVASNEIISTLSNIAEINMSGIVRKTYTTLGLPLKDGKINPESILGLSKENNKIGVQIQGTIRSMGNWTSTVQKKLFQYLGLPAHTNYGAGDFIISGDVSFRKLLSALNYYMENSSEISNACWEIHTELQTASPAEYHEKQDNEITPIIEEEYKRFKNLPTEIKNFSWYYQYAELLSAQMNIDKHPLLTGPAYMFYDCLHTANSIFFDCFSKSDNGDVLMGIPRLRESHTQIENFIRCANRLTDQLTRTDDVIFYGLGRIPAIASTLPEMALEFYYAFFLSIAQRLIALDKVNNRVPTDFEFGILLAPELNRIMRIQTMFSEDRKYRNRSHDKLTLWPHKQVYIIEFPVDDIYKPLTCFIPLAHECFHYFGDLCRQRDDRFYFMAMFVASTFLTSLNFNSKLHYNLFMATSEILCSFDEAESSENLYISDAADILLKNLSYLLTPEGLHKLYERVDKPYYLYSTDTLERWEKIRNGSHGICFPESLYISAPETYITACKHYFRECHADIMAIDILNIYPSEYLDQVCAEILSLQSLEDSIGLQLVETHEINIAQRVAIVLSAYCAKLKCTCNERWDEYRVEECEKALAENEKKIGVFTIGVIRECFKALLYEDRTLRRDGRLLPTDALIHVVSYLIQARECIRDNRSTGNFDELAADFDSIIRNGEMFGKRFYEIILQNRKRVEELHSASCKSKKPRYKYKGTKPIRINSVE